MTRSDSLAVLNFEFDLISDWVLGELVSISKHIYEIFREKGFIIAKNILVFGIVSDKKTPLPDLEEEIFH